ncbi:MAG: D-alanine--D-alanine ligase family protein [Thermoleophilaceae bacterium]
MRVAVLGGGRSSEHDVSLASAEAVRDGLREGGHEPLAVEISREGRWTHAGGPVELRPAGGLLGADVAFPVLHGPYGEDGVVQGLLESVGVPYVGAGVMASAVSMDKVVFKDLMAHGGVPQVDYRPLREGDDSAVLDGLGLPVFVKPARLGSSVGISRVDSAEQLPSALAAAFEHDPLVIVEALAVGIEVECSVLGDERPEASVPGQIVLTAEGAEWYDYEAKYSPGGMELRVPPDVSEGVRERVRELAVEAFERVGCAGMARVDFFVEDPDDERSVLVNELNTIPGFTSTSVYAKLFDASGLPYVELLERLLALALARHERERRYRF